MGKKGQIQSASLWSVTEMGIQTQRMILDCGLRVTSWHRNSRSVLNTQTEGEDN